MIQRIACISLLLAVAQVAMAGEPETLAELRATVAELRQRLELLERHLEAVEAESFTFEQFPVTEPGTADEKVRFSGDFRYRYEEISLQGSDTRTRTRFRARAGLIGKVGDTIELGFGLASGGHSPTSSTQTLGNGGSKKAVALDLAYANWSPVKGMNILAGKFANPLLQVPSHSMMWDDEWRPEGLALSYSNEKFFASLLSTWLESDSQSSSREHSFGGHIGLRRELGSARLTTGVGYFDFSTTGKGTFYSEDLEFAGNSFLCTDVQDIGSCVYANDYREVDLFAMLDSDFGNVNAAVYGHLVRNLDAQRFDIGWTAGAKVSTTVRDQLVQFDYFYRDLEADAVLGLLSNSDFGGGGADVSGHYFKIGWKAASRWVLSATYFENRIGGDAGTVRDYSRVQLNADFKY